MMLACVLEETMESPESLWSCRMLRAGVLVAGLFLFGGCSGSDDPEGAGPCAETSCEAGVCDSESGECVNDETCGDDSDCIAGYECDAGSCRETPQCREDADCDGGFCTDDGECRTQNCSQGGDCPEEGSCETALDCVEGRMCVDQSCKDAETCKADDWEPNESSDAATYFTDVASGGTLAASVCSGDVDTYAIETTELASADETGTLVVEVDIPTEQRGLGEVALEVYSPEGSAVGSKSTGAMGAERDVLEVTWEVDVPDHGEYRAEVRAGEDMDVSGVDYELSAEFR